MSASQQMRVMHVLSGDLWAGAEVQAYTLLKQLQQVCQLCVVLLNPGRLERELEALGIEVVVLNEAELRFFGLLFRLKREMVRFQPEVVHSHRQKENVLASLANLASVRAVCLQTVHGSAEFNPSVKQRIQGALEWCCSRYLQRALIAVSAPLKLQLSRHYPERQLTLIFNGIDVAEIREQLEPKSLPGGEPALHLGIVGRLQPVKRVDLFIELAERLVEQLSTQPWQFHIFGDGPLKESLQTQAERSQAASRLHFHGHSDQVRDYMSQLDLLVMTSDHEGLPMVALEALALEVPVLAHAVGALPELIGNPNLLVEQHSVDGYYQKVAQLLESGLPAVKLAEAYSAHRNAEQTFELYQRLLAKQ